MLKQFVVLALVLGSGMMAGSLAAAQEITIVTDADYSAALVDSNKSFLGNIVPRTSVKDNAVIIGAAGGGDVPLIGTSSTNLTMVAGGASMTTYNVADNTVTVYSGQMKTVAGGVVYLGTGAVTGNRVTVNGGTICNTDETAAYAVYGGAILAGSDTDGVTGNVVTVNDGTINGWVVGGGSNGTGIASDNKVYINGGTISGKMVAGGSSASGPMQGNAVYMTGGTVTADVYGGRTSGGAAADGNTVSITGGTVNGSVSGAEIIDKGTALSNTVEISNAVINGSVYGANAFDGTVGKNTVTINSSTINGDVKGGVSNGAYEASNNTINFLGGTIGGDVIGGDVAQGGKAINNTINLKGTLNTTGTLFGGMEAVQGLQTTGNTLNIYSLNNKVSALGGFANINFYLPAETADGSTVLTIDGNYKTNLSKTTVSAGVLGGSSLAIGDTVTLMINPNFTAPDTIITTGMGTKTLTEGVSTEYGLDISSTNNAVLATITASPNGKNAKLLGQTQSLTETRTAMAALVNKGADLAAGTGMIDAREAAANDGIFVATDIFTLRNETGSYVDSKGIALELGYAKTMDKGSTKVLVAPFLEYGYGKYDSYLDSGLHADGKSHFYGGGILVRADRDSGLYYEGSLRYGRITSDYKSNELKNSLGLSQVSYDTAAPYFAAHVGIGKINQLPSGNSLDVYGKYFYSRTGSDSATLSSGETYDFDAVTSNRLRVGSRYIHPVTRGNIYAGLGVEHEFSGEARATYKNNATGAPTLRGTSGLMEIGWQIKPSQGGRFYTDLGLTGWVGRQRGVTFNADFGWNF